jgi:hypothetical protein
VLESLFENAMILIDTGLDYCMTKNRVGQMIAREVTIPLLWIQSIINEECRINARIADQQILGAALGRLYDYSRSGWRDRLNSYFRRL